MILPSTIGIPSACGYDYAQAGAYFINIVTQGRECLFGAITPDGEIALNDAGQIIERWWQELSNKYPYVITDAFVVMPNHFHGIMVITAAHGVGADLCVGPPSEPGAHTESGAHAGAPLPDVTGGVGADLGVGPQPERGARAESGAHTESGAHAGAPLPDVTGGAGADLGVGPQPERGARAEPGAHAGAPLPEIVQWFKTMTTNEYIRGVKTMGWPPFPGKLWQRNYYEHIIRNEAELDRIRTYIANNPTRWALDDENPARGQP